MGGRRGAATARVGLSGRAVILSSPAAQAAWREAIGAPSVEAVGVSEHSPAKLGSLGLDHIEAFDLPPGVETSSNQSES